MTRGDLTSTLATIVLLFFYSFIIFVCLLRLYPTEYADCLAATVVLFISINIIKIGWKGV